MVDNNYWEKIVAQLNGKKKANWAAHVLASNVEVLDEILVIVDKETIIRNCLFCYSVDFSAQPYLDEILTQFSISELLSAYKKLEKKPIGTAGALMWLLEDIDSKFKWAV